MQPGELERMAAVEGGHWWYRGLRDALTRTLRRPDLAPPAHPRVLDAGCGTGANLLALAESLSPSYLGGFDVAEDALAWARRRVPGADLYRSDLREPEVHVDALDIVVSLDVIYILGTESALPGLRTLVGRLRPGGLLVVNLPAYDWLHGEHDLAVGTAERYTVPSVRALLDRLGLRTERLSYRVCLPLPAIVAARLPGIVRVRRGRGVPRSDLGRPGGGAVGAALYGALRLENAWIARGARLPWGSSVFAVGRKAISAPRGRSGTNVSLTSSVLLGT
jgi:SAM-dependent methyltransferase